MEDEIESDTAPGVARVDTTDAPGTAHGPRLPNDTQFAKGTSGNPRGRPRGSRNKSTLFAQSLYDDVGKAVTEKAIALALEGDAVALRLCVERILPRQRDAAVLIEDFPDVTSAADCKTATAAVIRSAAAGEISPSQAQVFVALIEAYLKTLEVADFEVRLVNLEKKEGLR